MMSTEEISAQYAIDTERLAAWMSAHIDGFSGPVSMRQFAGGQSNPTFLVRSPERSYVLRRKPLGKLLPSAHAIDREFRLLRALQASEVPVAHAYAFCDDAEVIGSMFYVSDYIEGRIFWDAALPEVERAERRAVYEQMIRAQAALHSVDYAALGLSDFGRAGNYVERHVLRWTQQYRACETRTIGSMERLIEWLPRHVPNDQQTAVVHGDFRLDNVIFHPIQPAILAVLDWELATLGHPLVDLAYFCMRHHMTSADFRGLADLDLATLGIPPESQIVSQYCTLRGVPPIPAHEWTYYLAFSMFRLASILQGVHSRALASNVGAEGTARAARQAHAMAESGWRLVAQR